MMEEDTTLYVTDLDGTLLDDSAQVSAESARIIRGLVEEGARITVATARTPATVVPLLEECRLQLPGILMTGAALWDFPHRRYSGVHLVPEEMCVLIKRAAQKNGVTLLVYTLPFDSECLEVYATGFRFTEAMEKFIAERQGLELKRFRFDSARGRFFTPQDVVLYFGMDTDDKILALASDLKKVGVNNVNVYSDPRIPDVKLIEIFADGVSKASTLKDRFRWDRLVVFGDNINDLPMMAVADVAVAVGNAVPEVKEAADMVIGPNTSDSVARFIADDFHSRHNG